MRGNAIKLDQKDMYLQTKEINENLIAPIVQPPQIKSMMDTVKD
jgi:hypothetical protein